MNKTTVFEIKRFAVHDGDGIRTTVFFKGCPLSCLWCHNPEGLKAEKQLAFFEHKCSSCGICANVCKFHGINNGIHSVKGDKCVKCGICAKECPNEALTVYGKEVTVDEIFDVVKQDISFYSSSGGGVTLSGGECLLYPDFCAELLKKCKDNGIHTAVDTCGYVPRESIEKIMPYTDIFLYDIKAIDRDIHVKCTGKSNKLILDNLKFITENGKTAEIRVPYVPTLNSEEIPKIAEFISNLKNIKAVRLLPYHNYAGSKYKALKLEYKIPEINIPEKSEIEAVCRQYGFKCY